MVRACAIGVAVCVALSSSALADSSGRDVAADFLRDNIQNLAQKEVLDELENSVAGRFQHVEIEVTGIQHGKPLYGITTVLPLYDSAQDGLATFFQGRYSNQNGRNTVNLGLGQRFLLNHGTVIAGVNAFYDHEFGMNHNRIGVGGEILTSVGDIRINNYWAVSGDRTASDGSIETALSGYDAEIGIPLPYLPTTEVYAKTFRWYGVHGFGDLRGETYSLRAGLPWGFEVEAGRTSYVAYKADQNFVTVRFDLLNFGQSETVAGESYVSPKMYEFKDVSSRRFEKVRRENNIVKQVSRKSGGTSVVVFEGI